nr:helix-turn-helix domain-containing protein [Pseudomonas savastanoi]
MQALRRHRRTVSGASLAQELGVSLRTIRRDVATLQGMGADIDGEAGPGVHPQARFSIASIVVHGRRSAGADDRCAMGQSPDGRQVRLRRKKCPGQNQRRFACRDAPDTGRRNVLHQQTAQRRNDHRPE